MGNIYLTWKTTNFRALSDDINDLRLNMIKPSAGGFCASPDMPTTKRHQSCCHRRLNGLTPCVTVSANFPV